MKNLLLFFLLVLIGTSGMGQSAKVKNVILFIPDGTSVDVLSLARWYNGNQPLAVDEIVCGLSKTYSADSTIADSAPGGTALATGSKSLSGYVGVSRDSLPQVSLFELARIQGKSTGVAVVCEFPHATPVDFVCHYPARSYSSSDILIRQFVYNSPSLVFAGGGYYLSNYLKKPYSLKDTLQNRGFRVLTDRRSFDANTTENVWALFNDWAGNSRYLSHDADRNPAQEPSLAGMTRKAIEILSKNPKGFFLMVEGSQVDWAAHANEPFALITDFLAFDQAVAEGLKFAKADGQTLVVVCPDHGNGGISMGNLQSGYSPVTPYEKTEYDNLNIHTKIIEPLRAIQWSGRKTAQRILADSTAFFTTHTARVADTLALRYNLTLPADSLLTIRKIVRMPGWSADKKRDNLENWLGTRFSEQHFIGWTTTGHTGEDVVFGVYAPKGVTRLTGIVQNTDVARYISHTAGFGDLDADENLYVPACAGTQYPHYKARLTDQGLVFEHQSGKPERCITVPGNTDYYLLGQKKISAKSLIVNIKDRFYLPPELAKILAQ